MIQYPMRRIMTPLRRWKNYCGLSTLLLLMSASLNPLSAGDLSSRGGPDSLLRIAFSSSMFTEVNENDVQAAMKAWCQMLLRERGIPIDPQISILNGTQEISRAMRDRNIDAISLTTDEYWVLEKDIRSNQIVVGLFDGRIGEEYVLLVHRESGIERIEDLRGRNITLYKNTRMSLASAWLDTLLIKAGLEPASNHFSRVTQLNKLPRVILPLFFRQNDACVVTRRGFQTMSELNPQVGQQLKIIASSPELVPAAFFFRWDFSPSVREKALVELNNIHTSPAGQQALTVYQSERLIVQPVSVLNSSLELLESHRRLCAAKGDLKASKADSLSKEARAGVQ